MNRLNESIASDVSRAYDAIGRISQLRAESRATEIAQLSGGQMHATPDQVNAIADQLKNEMIADLTRDVRASLSFFVNTKQPLKG